MRVDVGASPLTSWLRRPAEQNDAAFLRALAEEPFRTQFQSLGDAALVAQLLALQVRAKELSYQSTYPDSRDEVLSSGGTRVGRLRLHRGESAWVLLDFAVAPEHRGQGLGASVIARLQREASEHGVPLQLSVDPDSRAVELYRRLGFRVVRSTVSRLEMEWSHDA
jgi:ribosomal protein S18 acetylase RimI-like enzyme